MDIQALCCAIEEREAISQENDPAVGKCQKALTSLCVSDIKGTISFLRNECTAAQLLCLSEVFDSIAEKSQSREFIEALRFAAEKFPEEADSLLPFIDFAEDCIYY